MAYSLADIDKFGTTQVNTSIDTNINTYVKADTNDEYDNTTTNISINTPTNSGKYSHSTVIPILIHTCIY